MRFEQIDKFVDSLNGVFCFHFVFFFNPQVGELRVQLAVDEGVFRAENLFCELLRVLNSLDRLLALVLCLEGVGEERGEGY